MPLYLYVKLVYQGKKVYKCASRYAYVEVVLGMLM